MAAKNKTPASPLSSKAGRAWLAEQLAAAERDEKHGPDGSWKHNETMREELAERAAFLRALTAKID